MSEPIRIAVVGLGRAGWNIHVKAVRDREDFRIVDLADPDEERRGEAAKELGCRTHASLVELLDKTDAEVVVVATPNAMHEGDAIEVMESGRHCVLEKPVAMDHASALRIIEASKRTGRKLFPHHQRRFGKEFRFLKEVIASGVIGRVFEIRLFWGNFARRNDWQTLAKNNGGLLNNHGPHALDLLLNLIDSPVKSLAADLQHVKDAGDTDDHVHLFMKTENGQSVEATLTTCCALPVPRMMLLGSNGTLSASDDKTAKLRYYDPSAVSRLEVVEGPAPGRRYGTGEELPWREEERAIELPEGAGNFYDNVAGVIRGQQELVVTPESAAEVIRVIEWARQEAGEIKLRGQSFSNIQIS